MWLRWFLILCLAATPAAAAARKKRGAEPEKDLPRVLVLDVGGGTLTPAEAGLVRDAVAREFAGRTKSEVLSTEDVRRVVDATARKQEADCDTDACLAELGAAMGASRVVHATVARLGARYVLTLALIDPDNAVALGRATAKADDVERLYDAVPTAVADLVGQERPEEEGGFPVVTVLGGTVTGLGVVATAVSGGAFGYLFSQTQDPDGDPAAKQAWLDYNQQLGLAALVSAGVLVVGGTVLVIGIVAE